ncbi:hypothetical protein CONLIGDRAFT_704433 [Coniochaeta ligniaria NRRL 30616]|uniref:RTA1-domain-containing protein n=1 Tax=Coniochaeta ligniaria NRRL 30616 TaxID=1408157 RepID=A0A1J7INM2_9PEZI|nr:hypothetical protein CONLIGDRAFT_704433 [Coniochaeta ligniaria NRRL 30616]
MGASGDCTTTGSCPVQDGFLSSPPSLVGSCIFLVAFTLLIPANFFIGIRYNTPLFSSTIIAGLLFEAVGYVGRILLNSNVASVSNFVIYMLGTIMGPAFITSAIYQILPHIAVLYGKDFTLISQPAYFSALFLVLDLLTLVFEAAGVAFAVAGGTQVEMTRGINILLAGLGLQLASIVLFLIIYWYFVYKLHHRRFILDPTYQDVYLSPKFKIFLLSNCKRKGMQVSIILILGRTAGRFASLIGGWSNAMNQSETVTLVLDGGLVLIACIILTAVPVGSVFRSAWGSTSPHFQRRSARRNGYRRPANISLPIPAPLPHAYSPGSPPYYSISSSPGHPLSPPLPTPPLHTFTPRSPPYHQVVQQQGPLSPPAKVSPGFARPPYEFHHGQPSIMSPGFSPGRPGFVPSHRRQEPSRSLVNSEALW